MKYLIGFCHEIDEFNFEVASNLYISRTYLGNEIVDHADVVGVAPIADIFILDLKPLLHIGGFC